MLIEILTHTPAWVFGVFALLAWIGIKQAMPSSAHLNRVIAVPMAMVAFAVFGVVTAFGHSPAGLWGVAGWAVAAVLVLAAVNRLPLSPGVRFDTATRRFHLPGSWVPLVLMMGIFLTKYVVAVILAMHPEYAHQTAFALSVSTLYGLFSGVFTGRALRLGRLAMRHAAAPIAA